MKNEIVLVTLFMGLIFVACDKEDDDRSKDENYNPAINAENFITGVTNTYFPLLPGKIYRYSGQTDEGLETTTVSVMHETRQILGVTCTIVRDVVSLDNEVIEDTYDWYAQDKDGNVWYFGEDVSNYENGVLTDKGGSFEAGVNDARPGIIMMASLVLELPYRQEYSFNIAEDWGKVIAKELSVTTPFRTFTNCIKTIDWNALEPDAPPEYKYYAPGIGIVKEEIADGSEVIELISIEE